MECDAKDAALQSSPRISEGFVPDSQSLARQLFASVPKRIRKCIKADSKGPAKLKARITKGFTLLEIMIVITIISILLGIAIPNFVTSREKTKASSCCGNLRQINQAKEQFAMANSLRDGMPISAGSLMPYLKDKTFPSCRPADFTRSVMSAQIPLARSERARLTRTF